MTIKNPDVLAEVLLPTQDLRNDLPFYTKVLGMRLENIFPADNPSVASFSGHGLRLRIEKGADVSPGVIRILTDDADSLASDGSDLIAPNGTRVIFAPLTSTVEQPVTQHEFVVRRLRDEAPWIIGRAGMHYRDLIESRLGGSIIASHIRIPDGGPVPDMVHFHKVGFQLIFCYRGWVDVVYEDQGPPMRLTAGDCFIQPPEIRHRVLMASDNVEVIEIGVPAEHVTEIDHEMELPTPHLRPDREWQGQKFVFNQAEGAEWVPSRLPGFVSRDTTIATNTRNVAGVQVLRKGQGDAEWAAHETEILFTFVMDGQMTLQGEGRDPHGLEAGDAFVIPPGMKTCYADASRDIELLEVSLPGAFKTILGD